MATVKEKIMLLQDIVNAVVEKFESDEVRLVVKESSAGNPLYSFDIGGGEIPQVVLPEGLDPEVAAKILAAAEKAVAGSVTTKLFVDITRTTPFSVKRTGAFDGKEDAFSAAQAAAETLNQIYAEELVAEIS